MVTITRVGQNRLDIAMSGKLDADAMRDVLDELVRKSADIENGRMLYDVIDYHLPSLQAIGLELSRLPELLGLMKKFERAAVLTDKAWIKKVSELEGTLFPGLEIKGFRRDQKEAAEAWLTR